MLLEVSLYVGLLTSHSFIEECPHYKCEPLNENNSLLVATMNGFSIGTMDNSYNERSYLVGYLHPFNAPMGTIEAGLMLSTGYTETPMKDYTVGGFLPYPVVSYSLDMGSHFAITVLTTGVVHNAGFKVKF